MNREKLRRNLVEPAVVALNIIRIATGKKYLQLREDRRVKDV